MERLSIQEERHSVTTVGVDSVGALCGGDVGRARGSGLLAGMASGSRHGVRAAVFTIPWLTLHGAACVPLEESPSPYWQLVPQRMAWDVVDRCGACQSS